MIAAAQHEQKHGTAPLFHETDREQLKSEILLSVHHLGTPTAQHLYRLMHPKVPSLREMQRLLRELTLPSSKMLNYIDPIDIESGARFPKRIYVDTTGSRRHIESMFGIPYRKPPRLRSRALNFLTHDIELSESLVCLARTTRRYGLPFGYEFKYGIDGKDLFPKVTVTHEGRSKDIVPNPDKIPYVNGYRIIWEYDAGSEQIGIGDIYRDATVTRKFLMYDQLSRSGFFKRLGWNKTIFVYVTRNREDTVEGSIARAQSFQEAIPARVRKDCIFIAPRHSYLDADSNLENYAFTRGDGVSATLPCFL